MNEQKKSPARAGRGLGHNGGQPCVYTPDYIPLSPKLQYTTKGVTGLIDQAINSIELHESLADYCRRCAAYHADQAAKHRQIKATLEQNFIYRSAINRGLS